MSQEFRYGFLTGPIVIADEDVQCDLRDRIWHVHRESALPVVVKNEARFVLLVEKLSIFKRLVEDHFHVKNRGLLACGNGYPSRGFRRFLRHLHDRLDLPLYILADNDPAGFALFFLMAHGATGRSTKPIKENTVPQASFLGVCTGDASQFGLDNSVQIRLSDSEFRLLLQLKRSPWVRNDPKWRQEIEQLLLRGTKVEMEAFCSRSTSFLADTYLPERLAAGDSLRL